MKKLYFIASLSLLFSCSDSSTSESSSQSNSSGSENTNNNQNDTSETVAVDFSNEPIDPKTIDKTDFSKIDIDTLTLEQTRIYRNYFAAKQGFLFMKAELRGYFAQTDWYTIKMEERWEDDDYGDGAAPIKYTEEEQKIIDQLAAHESKLKNQLYITGDVTRPNLNTVVNAFQFNDLNNEFISRLSNNGFAIAEADYEQLFHVYETNDYGQIPNYVTTDAFLQLYHMYFGYLLKKLEKDKFTPTITKLTKEMYNRSNSLATQGDENGGFLATFYAIGHYAISGNKLTVPSEYQEMYNDEIKKIMVASDDFSPFLGYDEVEFPYSLFKPRGHYTRDEEFKKYFRAMMWLQYAPFCMEDKQQLDKAILMAAMLKGTSENSSLIADYKSVFDPIIFLIGVPDNLSVMDIVEGISSVKLNKYSDALQHKKTIVQHLNTTKKDRNKIKPKNEVTCSDKINLMPQRYLADNEIILNTFDADSKESKRPYPMGLDVMAALGSNNAKDILLNELKEGDTWAEFPNIIEKLEKKFKDIDWNASVYNKWIESLIVLQDDFKEGPYYMQNNAWKKKNINTSLASWAELKHDAILYAEQPMAAECGGGGPPEPITVGYVEPNVPFWKKQIELIDLTLKMMKDNNLLTTETEEMTMEIREMASFLLQVSEKELKKEKLTDSEYIDIEIIGSDLEYMTLQLVSPGKYIDSWENVTGPDKKVSVIADIFTNNADNNPKKGILHVGTGNVNEIYVVVEIEGYLYLTKGAVLSYHEFTQPMGTRLTDEEWQEKLKQGKATGVPSWFEPLIIKKDNKPKNNEKIFYSSGC